MSGTVQNNFEETDCLTTHVLKAFVSSDEKLEKITELFWDFETMGIKNNETEEKQMTSFVKNLRTLLNTKIGGTEFSFQKKSNTMFYQIIINKARRD